MNSGKRNTARKVICLVLAVLILGSLVSGALIMTVGAASSKEIEKELIALREEQAELKKQSDALQSSIKDNQAQTLVEKKADIDQQMEMSRQSIENLNEQIQQYSLLIAQKQDELEQTEAEEARLNEQYKTRLRSMEETGTSRSLRVNASALRAIWTMGSSKWVCRRTGKMSMKLPTVLRAPAKYCSRLNTGMLMIMSS